MTPAGREEVHAPANLHYPCVADFVGRCAGGARAAVVGRDGATCRVGHGQAARYGPETDVCALPLAVRTLLRLGFPALLYQIVWQRTLFAIYGVNIESVTVVVSAFMLGLGLGSLAGGRVSKISAPLLLIFGAVELGIAAFGLVSLPLFHWVWRFTAGAPPLQTGILFVLFALVVIPTIGMGVTLPLLVSHLVKFVERRPLGRHPVFRQHARIGRRALRSRPVHHALPGTVRVGQAGGSAQCAGGRHGAGAVLSVAPPESRRCPTVEATGKARPALPFPMGLVLAAIAGIHLAVLRDRVVPALLVRRGRPAGKLRVCVGSFPAGIAFGSLLVRRLCRAPSNLARFARSIAGLWHSSVDLTRFRDCAAGRPDGAEFSLHLDLAAGRDCRGTALSDLSADLSYIWLARIAKPAPDSAIFT